MSYYMRLQNLPIEASSKDIRHFFRDHAIPKGGIHIVGGIDEEAFINFSDELDLLKALQLDNHLLLGQPVRLLLEKKDNEEHNQFKELLEIGKPTLQNQSAQQQPAQHLPSQTQPSQDLSFYHLEEVIEPERPITPIAAEPQPLFGQPVKFALAKKEEQKSAMPTLSYERFGTTASQWFKRQLGISADDSSSESDEEPQSSTLSAIDIASLMSGFKKSNEPLSEHDSEQDIKSSSKHYMSNQEKQLWEVSSSSADSDSDEVKRGASSIALHKSRWDARSSNEDSDGRKEEVKKDETRRVVRMGKWDASSCSEESDGEQVETDKSKRIVTILPIPPKRDVEKTDIVKDSKSVNVKTDGSLSIIRATYSGSSSDSSEDEREKRRSRHDKYERSKRRSRSRERKRDRKDSRDRYRSYSSRHSEGRYRSRHSEERDRSKRHRHSREREKSIEDNSRSRRREKRKDRKHEDIPLPPEHDKQDLAPVSYFSARIFEKEVGFLAAAHVIVSNLDCTVTRKAIREFFSGFEIPANGITLKVKSQNPNSVKAGVIFPKRAEATKAEKMHGTLNGKEIKIKFLSRRIYMEELKDMKNIVEDDLNPEHYSKIETPPPVNPISEVHQSYKDLPNVNPEQHTGFGEASNAKPQQPPSFVRPSNVNTQQQPGFAGSYAAAGGGGGSSDPSSAWASLPGPPGAFRPSGPPGMVLMAPGMRPPVQQHPISNTPPGPMQPGFGPLGVYGPRGSPGFGPPRPMPSGLMPQGFGPPGSRPSGHFQPGFCPPGSMSSGHMPRGFGSSGPMPSGHLPPGFRPLGPMQTAFRPPGFRPSGPWPQYRPSFPPGFRAPMPPQAPPVSEPQHKTLSTEHVTPSQVSISKKPVLYHSSAVSVSGTNNDSIPIAELCGTKEGHIRIENLDATIKASELWAKLKDCGAKPNSVMLVQGPEGKAVFAFAAYKRTIDRLKFVNFNLKGMTCTLASQKARTTELVDVSPKHQISMASNSSEDHVLSERQLYTLKQSLHVECSKQEKQAQKYQESLRLMCVSLNPAKKDDDDVAPTKKELTSTLIEDPRKAIRLNLKQQRKADKYQEGLRLMCMDINTVKKELESANKIMKISEAEQNEEKPTSSPNEAASADGAASATPLVNMEETCVEAE